jgi:hypothetical protein
MTESARARPIASFLARLLAVAWYGLAAAIGIAVLLVLSGSPVVVQLGPEGEPNLEANTGARMTMPVTVALDADRVPIVSRSSGGSGAELRDLRGSLAFAPPRGMSTTVLAAVVIMLAILLWVIGELRALVRTLRDGQPFVAANARRVRHIGWAIIVGELARAGMVFYGTHYAMRHFSADGLRFDVRAGFDVSAIVCGLIVLAIAEVFREGTRLDEDRSLTI